MEICFDDPKALAVFLCALVNEGMAYRVRTGVGCWFVTVG